MCILCVIQKWSRRIATMLPWLVIPLIGLWALSQLLPPAFHFEITSPRLACVLVLLITLFWYEVLMPQLSAWQTRRNARLRERMRCEAIELQKLRKTATRRCRNCLTPYRDQNPGGGKFMCSCCGHISKRPVLDLPMPPEMGGGSGILRDVVGKGGRLLNGKQRLESGWFCGQEWMENANLAGGSFSGKSSPWNLNGGWLYGGDDEQCTANTSYSRAFVFVCKVFATCILSVIWLWRRVFGISSSREDASVDAERRGMLDNRSENGANGQESRGDKARRKAEEKRQARLEKELLEEEERKQREEVARLVEERRKLRDVKIEAEKKERGKGSPRAKERDGRKDSEKKRQERKKDRERGLSKSDIDTEEVEKRAGKDSDRNKNRETHRVAPENVKAHGTEQGHGLKGAGAGSYNQGYSGARYFDRMRGTILSSSRVLTGGSFFGKSSYSPSVSREHKPSALDDNIHTSGYRKDVVQPEWISGRSAVGVGGGDKNVKHPYVIKEPQPSTPSPKKSWQQLFTRSAASAVTPPSNSSVISRPIGKNQVESQEPPVSGVPTSTQLFNNPFSLPSFPFITTSSSSSPPLSSQPAIHKFGDPPRQFFPEESEIFEDPCYDPDPISLLGPVSESLDNFQLDLGFLNDTGLDKPRAVKTTPSEVSRPSSIGSPLSRSRPSEDRFSGSFLFPSTPKAHEYPNNVTDNVSRPMWSTLSPDTHGIVGGPSWLLPPSELNLTKDGAVHSMPPQKTMASLFKKDGQAFSNAHATQNTVFGNSQNGGTYNTSVPDGVKVPWLPQPTLFATSGPENQSLLKPKEEAGCQNGLVYRNSGTSAANHQFELSGANSWVKQDGAVHGSRDVTGNSPMNNRGHVGGLYSPPDVQPFWSYD